MFHKDKEKSIKIYFNATVSGADFFSSLFLFQTCLNLCNSFQYLGYFLSLSWPLMGGTNGVSLLVPMI